MDPKANRRLFDEWLSGNGEVVAQRPCMKLYRKTPRETAAEHLVTGATEDGDRRANLGAGGYRRGNIGWAGDEGCRGKTGTSAGSDKAVSADVDAGGRESTARDRETAVAGGRKPVEMDPGM